MMAAKKKPRGKVAKSKGHGKKVAGKKKVRVVVDRAGGAGVTTVRSGKAKITLAEPAAKIWPQESKPAKVVSDDIKLSDIGFDDANQRHVSQQSAASIAGLAATIALDGLLQRIRVRAVKPSKANGGKRYVVVFGHRRVLACRQLGWEKIKADVVVETAEEQAATSMADVRAIENVQREDLTSIEQSLAIGQMLAAAPFNITVDSSAEDRTAAIKAVAERIGKSETWVRERDMLSRLTAKVQGMVTNGSLSLAKAVLIARIVDPDTQEDLAIDASDDGDGISRFSLEQVRSFVKARQLSLKVVTWKLDEKIGGCPSCSTCPNNSANNRGLFAADEVTLYGAKGAGKRAPSAEVGFELGIIDQSGHGFCLNGTCYEKKRRAADAIIVNATKKAVKAIEASGGGKANDRTIPVTAKSLAEHGLMPDKVEPAAVVKLIKSELKEDAPSPSKSGRGAKQGGGGGAQAPAPQRVPTIEEEATSRWMTAAEKWKAETRTALGAAILAVPGRRTLLALVRAGSVGAPFHAVYYGDRSAKQHAEDVKAWNAPRLLAALGKLNEPTLEALCELEADMDRKDVGTGELPQHIEGLASLARVLGLKDFGTAPKLEAFRSVVMSERSKKEMSDAKAEVKATHAADAEKPTTKSVRGRKKKSLAEAEEELNDRDALNTDALAAAEKRSGEIANAYEGGAA